MEDRIYRALVNVRRQKYPLTEALDTSCISEDQMKDIMKTFWTPTEVLHETCDRIRSSSIDDPELPPPPEEQAINLLEEECGIHPRVILKSISVLKEGLETKLEEIFHIEKSLKDSEETLVHYNKMIKDFKKNIQDLPFDVDISGKNMFLESLNYSVYTQLKRDEIPEKLKKFQLLMTQIRTIRSIMRSARFRDSTDGGSDLPVCKICYTHEVKSALVPCGHMFCEECLSNLPGDQKCFTCRRKARQIIRLYPN